MKWLDKPEHARVLYTYLQVWELNKMSSLFWKLANLSYHSQPLHAEERF